MFYAKKIINSQIPYVINAIIAILLPLGLTDTDSDQIIIVKKNQISLYAEPDEDAEIMKKAFFGLQLKIMEISNNKMWYKVKIGEDKGYQLKHGERFWVRGQDVYKEVETPFIKVKVDLSLFEDGDIKTAQKLVLEIFF